MTKYQHLSLIERYQLQALLGQAIDPKDIARQLGRHRSTIEREIARGIQADGLYCAQSAQALSDQRKLACRNAKTIASETWKEVDAYLSLHLSAQQVSCRLRAELAVEVSHESVYLYIYRQLHAHGRQIAELRCSRKRRKKRCTPTAAQRNQRGAIHNRISIEQRPAVVDEKSRIGDWEGDTIVGRKHLGGLVTLVDRVSRYTLAYPVTKRCALPVCHAICEMLGPYAERCHTITLDNGSEFALHQQFAAALGTEVYFAKPHSPWQRGLNENTNGLLRQYFPKGSSMHELSMEQVQYAVDRLNHRPRKCLGWRTPHEVFFNLPMTRLTL